MKAENKFDLNLSENREVKMVNKIKIIKSLMMILIILMLVMESLAAAVSDNDGSAFITKAEFDSLKNNFQTQIDQYNTTIDSKIDDAIASYLSGVKVEQERQIDSIIYRSNTYKNVVFSNNWTVPYTIVGDKCTVASFLWSIWNFKVLAGSYYTLYEYGMMNSTKANSPSFVEDTKGTVETQICQPSYNDQYGTYSIDNGSFWKITPYAYALAFRWHSQLHNAWVNSADAANVTMSLSGDTGTWLRSSDETFGSVDKSLTVTFGGLTTPPASQPMDGTYITGTKDTVLSLSSVVGGENVNKLASNYVDGIVKATTVDDWNTVENTACYVFDVNNDCGYKLGDYYYGSNRSGNVEVTITNWPTNLPKFNVYNKKNTNLNASELIVNGWTSLTGNPIYYYSGMPLFDSVGKGIIELELEFEIDVETPGLSNGASYSITDHSFSNSDSLDTATVTLYTDKDLKTKYTTLNFSGDSHSKKLYFEAEAGKTYWIKAKPYTTNGVKVNTKESTIKLMIKN